MLKHEGGWARQVLPKPDRSEFCFDTMFLNIYLEGPYGATVIHLHLTNPFHLTLPGGKSCWRKQSSQIRLEDDIMHILVRFCQFTIILSSYVICQENDFRSTDSTMSLLS